MKWLLVAAALALSSCIPVGPAPEELEDLRRQLDEIQKAQKETREAVERVEKSLDEMRKARTSLRPPRRKRAAKAPLTFGKCADAPEQLKESLPKKEVDDALADPGKLSRSARIVPNYRDASPHGFKLLGMKPDTLYVRAGLNNGDVILSVNDLAITSPSTALDAYAKLEGATELALLIDRRGKLHCLNLKFSP